MKEEDIKGFVAVVERAYNLINGNDICIGGDEWCTQTNNSDELKGWLMLEDVYKQIKPYEKDLKICAEKTWYDKRYEYLLGAIKSYETEGIKILDLERKIKRQPQQTNSEKFKDNSDKASYKIHLTDKQERTFCNAIKEGLIEKTTTGYKRKQSCSKAMLGYFIERVFAPTNQEHIPYKALEVLFNEIRLDRTINANHDVNSPQKWRYLIDNIIGK